jgi:hypothetical protein
LEKQLEANKVGSLIKALRKMNWTFRKSKYSKYAKKGKYLKKITFRMHEKNKVGVIFFKKCPSLKTLHFKEEIRVYFFWEVFLFSV